MAHKTDLKTLKISFRVGNGFKELLDLLVEKTNLTQTEIVREFFVLGVDEGFESIINEDLKHWEFGFDCVKKITEGRRIRLKIDRIIQLNKFQGGENE